MVCLRIDFDFGSGLHWQDLVEVTTSWSRDDFFQEPLILKGVQDVHNVKGEMTDSCG